MKITLQQSAEAAMKIAVYAESRLGQDTIESKERGEFFEALGVDPQLLAMLRDEQGDEAAIGFIMGAVSAAISLNEDPLPEVEVDFSKLRERGPADSPLPGMLGLMMHEPPEEPA